MLLVRGFRGLSELLTGVSGLNSTVAADYETLLRSKFNSKDLDRLIEVYEGAMGAFDPLLAVVAAIDADAGGRLRLVAEQIVKLWYFSQHNDPADLKKIVNAGRHKDSLAWRLVGATPPSYSEGSYGYWVLSP